jgi:hypothetical protein
MITTVLRRRPRLLPFVGGRGDQRDDFAFLLEVNGFTSQARALRRLGNDQSYWALSDAFVASVLGGQDNREAAERGVRVLEEMLSLYNIASSSQAIVRLNIARLALVSGDQSKAEEIVREESDSTHKEAKLRIKSIAEFKAIVSVSDEHAEAT